jgi:WD40 repeat protein
VGTPTALARPERHDFDVFLSYNSNDRRDITRIAHRLRERGVRVWFDRWCLTAGGNWQEELAGALSRCASCAIFIGPDDLGPWTRQEMYAALNRAAKDRSFRIFPVLLPGLDLFEPASLPPFLATRTWVDLRSGPESEHGQRELRKAILGVALASDLERPPSDDVCPYRGLEVFDEEHSRFYFGREAYVQRLVESLKASRFLAVVGPSGSGKSSLVRAGLIPRLRSGALAGSGEWRILVMRPGAQPLAALAGAVHRLDPGAGLGSVVDELRSDRRTLHLAAAAALADEPPTGRVVVVVDQSEELFTLCRSLEERTAFLAALHYAAVVPDGRVTVVLSLRADFYARLVPFRDLAQLVQSHQVLVGGLDENEVRQVIEEPARAVGLDVEPGLVETIVGDVMREAGTLPLLEHALLETWRRRGGGMLTLRAYQDSGGVERGLADRAETLYATLDETSRTVARHLLLRLTQPGEGTEDTRRRIALAEVSTEPDPDVVEHVIGRFVDERLLSASTDEEGGETYIEVSHEALFTAWPRYLAWIGDDRAGLMVHRRLTLAAQEWQRLGRDAEALLRGGRLAEVVAWHDESPRRLNDVERDFLQESGTAEAAARSARRRNLATAFGALITALAVITTVAVVAIAQGREAARQRDVAISRQLAASAVNALPLDPALALALALRGIEQAYTGQADEILRRAAHESRGLAVLRAPSGPVRSVRFLPDGRRALAAGNDGSIRIWDVGTGQVERTWTVHRAGIITLRPSPDGRQVVSGSEDGAAALTDVAGGASRTIVRARAGQFMTAVAFSPEGRRVAAGTSDGVVTVVDVDSGTELFSTDLGDGLVYDVAFSPDGRSLVSAGPGRSAHMSEATTGASLRVLGDHDGEVLGVGFSPAGEQVITSDGSGSVRLWNTDTGAPAAAFHVADEAIYTAVFSPDGRRFVTSGEDSVVRVLSRDGIELAALRGHVHYAFDAAFDPAGKTVVSGGQDGTVRIWRSGVADAVRAPITGVTLSPDGRHVAAGGADGVLRMWSTVALTAELTAPHHAGRSWASFSPDGSMLVTAGVDGRVVVRSVTDGTLLAELRPHGGRSAWSAAIDPTGAFVASGGQDGAVVVSSLTGAPPEVLSAGHGPVYAVRFGPDGRSVLTGGQDGTVVLWEPDRSSRLFPTTAGAVADVAFHPDGRLLASAHADGSVHVWHRDGGHVAVLRGHDGGVNSVQFSPDGRQLQAAGADGQVIVWDRETTRTLLAQPMFDEPATAAVLSPDGTFVAAASELGRTLQISSSCDVCGDLTAVLALARSRAIRELTTEEEQSFLD